MHEKKVAKSRYDTERRNVLSYDALGRVLRLDLPGTEKDVVYAYDRCVNGVGRLCEIQDESGALQYEYDAFGNVVKQSRVELAQTYVTRTR